MNPNKITTTVGLNIGKIDIAGICLNFWDLGGQEELQSLWDKVSQVTFFFLLRVSWNKMLVCKSIRPSYLCSAARDRISETRNSTNNYFNRVHQNII